MRTAYNALASVVQESKFAIGWRERLVSGEQKPVNRDVIPQAWARAIDLQLARAARQNPKWAARPKHYRIGRFGDRIEVIGSFD